MDDSERAKRRDGDPLPRVEGIERIGAAASRVADVFRSGTRRNDRLLASILHSITDGLAVVDGQGKLLFANDAFERIIGIPMRDLSPAAWSAMYGCYLPDKETPFPPEILPLTRAMRGEQVTDVEMFIRNPRRPSGVWISVNAAPLLEEGELIGGLVVFRDISVRRKAREVVKRLSKAVEKTTDCVFITDATGKIEYVNPAFQEVTGFGRDEALGRNPNLLKSGIHGPEFYAELWEKILAGRVHTGMVINRKKNGELFHAEQTITPIKDSSGNLTHFVAVVRDVTELKKAEEQRVRLDLARTVQQKLYPSRSPYLPGFDLAGAAFPANETAGDYFDFIRTGPDRVTIAIGDVSGHGLDSALLMAETRAYLRSLAKLGDDLGGILAEVNDFLCADTEDSRFVTLMLVRLDVARGSIVYASAGHNPGYLLSASGELKEHLAATGRPLGFFPGERFSSSKEMALEPGDLFVLLTDGVTERENPQEEQFGEERVLDLVRASSQSEASQIVEDLRTAAEDFGSPSPQMDDLTAVVCKVLHSD
jgi:sigma-B regulation protein RsbU (phosphoserine phosphatase)